MLVFLIGIPRCPFILEAVDSSTPTPKSGMELHRTWQVVPRKNKGPNEMLLNFEDFPKRSNPNTSWYLNSASQILSLSEEKLKINTH